MIISSQGEACSPNEDIKALDLHGTNALRDRLFYIASTGSGEAALLARAEIGLELEQEKQAELTKIGEAKQALQEFRDYLAQCSDKAARALPSEEELEYSYNPETQECEITLLYGRKIKLDLSASSLQGELPLPPQLMVTWLSCTNNQLTALPELPASLTVLYCYYNQLTVLPELPDNLTKLSCGNNQLTALPVLPASLTELRCNGNPGLASDPITQATLEAMRARGGSVSSL
jgi:Leucine-rich repeat (LRR) protein